MARYIDADKLIAHLKDEMKGCHLPFGSRSGGKGIAYGTILGLKSAISFAETLPTADVVPKSEVEELIKSVDDMLDLVCAMTGLELTYLGKYAELRKKYTEGKDEKGSN